MLSIGLHIANLNYCAKRKGKGNTMINVIIATYLIIFKGWKKKVTTYSPLILIFNKAITKSLCAESLLFSALEIHLFFFFQYGSTDASLPAY